MASDGQAQYWLLTGETPAGPYTVPQVHAELASGRATWQTPACPVGGGDWQPLVRTPGLGPQAADAPRPDSPPSTPTPPPPVPFTAGPPPLTTPHPDPGQPSPPPAIAAPERAGVAVGVGVLAAIVAVIGVLGYQGYEWVRPNTPTEVCQKLDAAKTATAAKAYVTERMHPVLTAMFTDPATASPDDKFEVTGEADGPQPGVKLVGFRGSFLAPEAGRRVAMEGQFRVVLSGGWRVDDMTATKVDGAALPGPVSLVDEYLREAARPGKAAAGTPAPGPVKPQTDPPYQGTGVVRVVMWFWNFYGVGGIVTLVVLIVIGTAIWEGVKRKPKPDR